MVVARVVTMTRRAEKAHNGLVCDDGGAPTDEIAASVPRLAEGLAVDPIALEPVDEVIITTLMDNSYDADVDTPSALADIA
jgi:hypothetical protein